MEAAEAERQLKEASASSRNARAERNVRLRPIRTLVRRREPAGPPLTLCETLFVHAGAVRDPRRDVCRRVIGPACVRGPHLAFSRACVRCVAM